MPTGDTNVKAGQIGLEGAECSLNVHRFSERLSDSLVHFFVLRMQDSFLLWVGTSPANLANMSVAMLAAGGVDKTAVASSLFGEEIDDQSSVLAQKMSKRTGKQVFVSYNVPPDVVLRPLVEKRLFREMTDAPHHFWCVFVFGNDRDLQPREHSATGPGPI